MRDWRIAVWLLAGSIYGLYNGLHWSRWQDLALWTRVHASIQGVTGVVMLLGAVAWLGAPGSWRPLILISAAAPAVLGLSLIAGTLSGTLPCTGAT